MIPVRERVAVEGRAIAGRDVPRDGELVAVLVDDAGAVGAKTSSMAMVIQQETVASERWVLRSTSQAHSYDGRGVSWVQASPFALLDVADEPL